MSSEDVLWSLEDTINILSSKDVLTIFKIYSRHIIIETHYHPLTLSSFNIIILEIHYHSKKQCIIIFFFKKSIVYIIDEKCRLLSWKKIRIVTHMDFHDICGEIVCHFLFLKNCKFLRKLHLSMKNYRWNFIYLLCFICLYRQLIQSPLSACGVYE